jgi:predicted AlkP superfamily pyrophosphatase or phosphodiesterase
MDFWHLGRQQILWLAEIGVRLVLISLDAVFTSDTDFLLSLPHLGRLTQEGVFCNQVQTIYPTLTYPVHTSLITGCYPDMHGIGHNEPFNPDIPPRSRPWYWDSKHILVETLFSQAKKAGRENATILWPVTGHSPHIRYNFPEILALPGENQVLKVLHYGSAGWLFLNELKFGSQRKGSQQPQLDGFATSIAQTLIWRQYSAGEKLGSAHDIEPSPKNRNRHMPDVLALHLVDCDAMRHRYGTFSREAREALTRLDKRVGLLIAALVAREALDNTVLAVVTDHGQADVTGSLPLDAWLMANKVPARAQSLGFGAYIRISRGDYHPVLNALRDHMEELQLRHVYTREELRGMHAPEDVLLAVEPEEGIAIVEEENVTPHAATHGFGLHHAGARCLMWLRGPMFKQGKRLEQCSIVDIAPTLARAAGLSLPKAQGRVLHEIFKGVV